MEITTLALKGQMLTHEEMDGNFITLKAGVEAAAEDSILAQFVGAVKAQVGNQPYYPRKPITIKSIFAYLSDVAGADVVAKVRVNGAVVETITITATHSNATKAVNIIVDQGSYLTVDIDSGTGTNLCLRLDY